jgi:glutathione S-transferase
MQLYSGPLSMFGAKAQIALHEKSLPFDLVMVPFDMERLYEPKPPAVERINPKRQVPVLIDGSTDIFDSTQIFEYLEDAAPTPPLWPTSVVDRARVAPIRAAGGRGILPSHHQAHGFAERAGLGGSRCSKGCSFEPHCRAFVSLG